MKNRGVGTIFALIFQTVCFVLKAISTQLLKTRHSISVSDNRSKHSKKGKNHYVTHINESIRMCMMDAVSISQAATCPIQSPIRLLSSIMSQQ